MMNRAVWIASRRLARAPTVASRYLGTQIYDSGSVTVSNLLKNCIFHGANPNIFPCDVWIAMCAIV
jgi:hypothetical protein